MFFADVLNEEEFVKYVGEKDIGKSAGSVEIQITRKCLPETRVSIHCETSSESSRRALTIDMSVVGLILKTSEKHHMIRLP